MNNFEDLSIQEIQENLHRFNDSQLVEIKEYLQQKKIEKARNNSSFFTEYVMKDETGQPIEQGEIHKEWHILFDEHRKVLLLAPRNHGKTTQVESRVLWEIGNNPSIRIKIISNNDDNATDRVSSIKQYIEESPEYNEVFPWVQKSEAADNWAKHSITVERDSFSRDPTLQAAGVMAGGTGKRADLIIFDDIVDEKNAIKHPSDRKTVKRKYRNVWLNLLVPDGREIYIGTRWHEDDLTGELLDSSPHKKAVYRIGEDLEPIWPEVWDKESLEQKKESIGPKAFRLGYMNEPLALEEQYFSPDMIKQNVCADYNPPTVLENRDNPDLFMGVDFARGTSARSSRSAIVVAMLEPNEVRRVVDIRCGKWGDGKIVDELFNLWEYYNPVCIMAENNSMQDLVITLIENIGDERKQPIKHSMDSCFTGKKKADLDSGLPMLASEMEMQKWKIPYDRDWHEENCTKKNCTYCLLWEELTTYPVGKSDDLVMAMWFCMKAIWKHADQTQAAYKQKAEQLSEFMRRESTKNPADQLDGVIDPSVFS